MHLAQIYEEAIRKAIADIEEWDKCRRGMVKDIAANLRDVLDENRELADDVTHHLKHAHGRHQFEEERCVND